LTKNRNYTHCGVGGRFRTGSSTSISAGQTEHPKWLHTIGNLTRYETGDGKIRLVCAVSAEHNESSGIPYYWFAVHRSQVDFLESSSEPYCCFGCGSSADTLLVPLLAIQDSFELLSVTKTDERFYWHVVIQKKVENFVLRVVGGKDGPDLTRFNIGKTAAVATI